MSEELDLWRLAAGLGLRVPHAEVPEGAFDDSGIVEEKE